MKRRKFLQAGALCGSAAAATTAASGEVDNPAGIAGYQYRLPRFREGTRLLFIGDSISGNYDRGLRDTLGEKVNIHHPPTNCGPSSKGAKSIVDWLGAYDQRGRHWDVISFNHGHWDAGNNIGDYQHNLELIIKSLKKTGAKLVWVTTCPVPYGFEQAGGTDDLGKAPGRKWGVMEKHLNPWALEVISRLPEITICDQWQFVKDNEDNLYNLSLIHI